MEGIIARLLWLQPKAVITELNHECATHAEDPPRVNGQANYTLVLATDACFDCAQACRAGADGSLLGEEELDVLRNCIQITLDCADVCFATGDLGIRRVLRTRDVMIRGTGFDERIMELTFETCAEVCHQCGPNVCAMWEIISTSDVAPRPADIANRRAAMPYEHSRLTDFSKT